MDMLDGILDRCKKAWSKVRNLFRPGPKPRVPFCPELARFFLTEAIEDRVKFLSALADVAKEEEVLRVSVLEEYANRVDAEIKRVFLSQLQLPVANLIFLRLSHGQLPEKITEEHCEESRKLIKLLRAHGVFLKHGLSQQDARVAWGLSLRAIQQVTLNIVSLDYPPKDSGAGVSEETQAVIRKTLQKLDTIARRLDTSSHLKSPQKAEIELRVALTRVKGDACLPLRPIPTAPLDNDDLALHYVGRSDEEALKLAHQLRHADGTILVTGYRGVGKSTFVNRAVYHAISEQQQFPADGALLIPVTVNLAKVAGVQHVLRLTIRALRDALIDPETRIPREIPRPKSKPARKILLPLDQVKEIEPLEEAYIRATYRVTMSRADGSERKAEFGSSFALDPGKLLGGSIVGIEIGKFLEGGIKSTSTKKINRELSLLDYDENAAEEDLARLIRSLATPRPLFGTRGQLVRIKLVFVFDELDKMDIDQGLKPMIEGLKNLFLQQYAVFLLVTSKKFYYDLLKDRAVEDAMLNSYFSAIIHVPLLSLTEVRKMVEDWIDWSVIPRVRERPQSEIKLIEQLTRVLLYRSSGNPRDIIRELRKMQQWWESTDQPYLSEQLRKTPGLQVIAAVQECIEKAAVREQTANSPLAQTNGAVALASERLEGDEARLEQVQRGLYILTEELINRGTLLLEPQQRRSSSEETDGEKNGPTSQSSATNAGSLEQLLLKLAKPSAEISETLPLAKIHKDNFSLVTFDDVQKLAKRLGQYLTLVHDTPDLFTDEKWGQRRPLFEMPTPDVLSVTQAFYLLTGRKALAAPVDSNPVPASNKTEADLIADAKNLTSQAGWAERLAAIKIIQQLGQIPNELQPFIWQVAQKDPDPNHRLLAIGRLTPQPFFAEKTINISQLLTDEKDVQVLAAYLGLVGGAGDDPESRKRATDALLALLDRDTTALINERLPDNVVVQVLTVLQSVADRDATTTLLAWLGATGRGDQVQKAAVDLLRTFARNFQVDIASQIIANEKALQLFTTGPRLRVRHTITSLQQFPLREYFHELLLPDPTKYLTALMQAPLTIDVSATLTYLWDGAFDVQTDRLAATIFNAWLAQEGNSKARLLLSLPKTQDFQSRLLPYLKAQYNDYTSKKKITADESKRLGDFIEQLEGIEADQIFTTSASKPKRLADMVNLANMVNVEGAKLGTVFPSLKIPTSLTSTATASNSFNLEDYIAKPTVQFSSTTPLSPSETTTTTAWSSKDSNRGRSESAVYLILALVSFAIGFFLFKRDLPAGATFATTLASRLILLVMDTTIVLWLLYSLHTAGENVREVARKSAERKVLSYDSYGTASDSSWSQLIANPSLNFLFAMFFVYGLYSLHVHYIGPLTRWNQILQFLINLPTIALLFSAWPDFRSARRDIRAA